MPLDPALGTGRARRGGARVPEDAPDVMDRPPSTPPRPRPSAQESTHESGRRGEALALEFLTEHGFRILARNLRSPKGEIDLLALEGTTLCFVEVKLRRSERFGSALESVDARKQRRIIAAARDILATRMLPRFETIRFDVVTVADAPRPVLHLLREAFYVSSW